MHSFKDAEGRSWNISITVNELKAIRNSVSVDGKGFDLIGGDITDTLYQLSKDPVLLVDVLYVICRKQCEERKVSDIQFGEALVGDSIEHAADAMMEELTDFFPHERREQMKKLLTIGRAAEKQINLGLNSKIAKLTPEQIAKAVLGTPSTKSPAKQASSRGRTPSAS